jgi:hypothetical protein
MEDMVDSYWEMYLDVHENMTTDVEDEICLRTQSFFKLQAFCKILKEYGWWDFEKSVPINW